LPDFPASAKQQIRIDIGPDLLFGSRRPLCFGHLASRQRNAAQLLIQPEFSVLKANLMAVPHIVAIFAVSARATRRSLEYGGHPAWRRRAVNASRPQNEEPNDEDEVFSGSAAAPAVTRGACRGSGAKQQSAAGSRGPRGRGSVLERCLHD
jgi:hypothetical protein